MEIEKNPKEDILNKIEQEKEINLKKELREIYFKIIEILKEYIDMREDYYSLIALWIIGTYFHKEFPTYPYLYFNAMKGSGKTRILNLLSNLAHNGKLLISLSEAVLFRTASQSSFFIDEFERVGGKDKQALRELLNAGYKKGLSVERAKKVKKKGLEGLETVFEIERYNLYCPIAMANIWGMDEVLGDRCLTLTLERSNNSTYTKKIEDFENNEKIKEIKAELGRVSFSDFENANYPNLGGTSSEVSKSENQGRVCRESILKKTYIYKEWNTYINRRYNSTNSTNSINSTLSTNSTNSTYLFDKIGNTELNARHLELFFPLFILSYDCGEDILDEIIKTSKIIIQEKKEADVDENRDIMLIECISQKEKADFIPLGDLLKEFKDYFSDDEEEKKWINSRWLGRALKRLVLIKNKRTINGKRQVVLDIEKAKKKILMFKPETPPECVESSTIKETKKTIESYTKQEK